MLESGPKNIERLKQEQAKLEELLFLVNRDRRPRVQKMIAQLRAQIAGLEALDEQAGIPVMTAPEEKQQKSLEELRQEQSDLEETLFIEPPERRPHIKKLLAKVRAEIAAAVAELTPGEKGKKSGSGKVAS